MKKVFGNLFIRCTTDNYKTRIYTNRVTKNKFRVRTLAQWVL